MIKLAIHYFTFSLLIFLCGCATFEPSSKSISWKSRVTELNRIQSWTAQGSVSIQQVNKTDIASLQWHQQNDHYQIKLFGPLGFGQVEIIGTSSVITLNQSNHSPISAATPDLIQSQLGWYMPISNLYYWVRGLSAPSIASKKTFDAYGRLTQLKQEGWMIEYLEYTMVNHVELPRKIQLSTHELKIKLVIREWKI